MSHTDRWVWLGLLLVMTLSGLVAWVGDWIGRRIGRRRLTFLGLRPRNTAILFTVLTGMLIAALAMAALLLASEGARKRILQYSTTVSQLQQRADEQQARRERAEQLALAAGRAKDRTEQDLVKATQAFRTAETARRSAETQSQTAQGQLRATRQQAETARRELVAARARRDEAQRRWSAAEQRVAQARVTEAALNRRLAGARDELSRLQEEISRASREISNALRILNNRQGELSALQEQRDALELDYAAARGELAQARQDRDQLLAERERLRQAAEQLQREALRTLSGEIVVRFEEELGRTRVRENLPPGRASEQLDTFLREVDRRARELGAGPDPDHDGAHAVLFGVTNDGTLVESTQFLPFVLRFLETANRSVWLRAIALRNTVEERPVPYTLRLDPDRIVFAPGEVLATAAIDGRQDDVAVARALEALVRDQVNLLAQQRGLLPNPSPRYTVVGPEQWFPALRTIREANRLVTVEVVARNEIRSGDSLDVEFRVRHDDRP